MYLEEAEVKEYKRKNGTKYKQLHLGTNSKFKKSEKVAVVRLEEIEKLTNPDYIDFIEVANESLESENKKLEHDLQEVKEEVENLNSKLAVAKEEIFKLQEEKENLTVSLTEAKDVLLTEKDKLEDKNKEIIQLQKEHKEEIKEANSKIEKLLILVNSKDKDIVYLAERGLAKRILNRLPERIESLVRTAKESEEVESDSISEE